MAFIRLHHCTAGNGLDGRPAAFPAVGAADNRFVPGGPDRAATWDFEVYSISAFDILYANDKMKGLPSFEAHPYHFGDVWAIAEPICVYLQFDMVRLLFYFPPASCACLGRHWPTRGDSTH